MNKLNLLLLRFIRDFVNAGATNDGRIKGKDKDSLLKDLDAICKEVTALQAERNKLHKELEEARETEDCLRRQLKKARQSFNYLLSN